MSLFNRTSRAATRRSLLVALVATTIPLAAMSADLMLPNMFVNGEVADADAVNANFLALEDEANDKEARLVMLEDDADDHEDRIVYQEDLITSLTVVVNSNGSLQYVSDTGLTVTRTSAGNYELKLPPGGLGSSNGRPVVTVMPLGQRYISHSVTSYTGGRWVTTLRFRNFSGTQTDTIFHAVFAVGS